MTADAPVAAKKSDLKVRTASAIVMLAIVGFAFWSGGVIFQLFLGLIFVGLMWEWSALILRISSNILIRGLAIVSGFFYLALPIFFIWVVASGRIPIGGVALIPIIGAVIATDVGAYFTGRTLGGPKLAPRISPNKTWSGLIGGMLLAGIWTGAIVLPYYSVSLQQVLGLSATGAVIGLIAQAGDLLESWMKRKAGVKDSGHLIPGHGGLFDRLDGYLAVFFVLALVLTFMFDARA